MIYVLSTFLIIPVVAFVAFATDVGYLNTVRSELQRTADSSALAAVAALYPQVGALSATQYNLTPDPTAARATTSPSTTAVELTTTPTRATICTWTGTTATIRTATLSSAISKIRQTGPKF